jgi:hypothetical protein
MALAVVPVQVNDVVQVSVKVAFANVPPVSVMVVQVKAELNVSVPLDTVTAAKFVPPVVTVPPATVKMFVPLFPNELLIVPVLTLKVMGL